MKQDNDRNRATVRWKLFPFGDGGKIMPENKGLQSHNSFNTQSVKSLFKIIGKFSMTKGWAQWKTLPHFQEHICNTGDEKNEVIKFKAKNCSKVLPFKT